MEIEQSVPDIHQDITDLKKLITKKYGEVGWEKYMQGDLVRVFGANLRIFEQKNFHKKATLWILFGPQGSGKTTVASILLKGENIVKTDCVHCGIDDLVYSCGFFADELAKIKARHDYKEFTTKILNYAQFLEDDGEDDRDLEKELMDHPVRKVFIDLYWKIRKVMDPINDTIMDMAIKWQTHIIFEIVGVNSSSNSWYQDLIQRCAEQKIYMHVVYPYVDQKIVKVRFLRRAVKENYALNLYDKTLVPKIMADFKLFSGSALKAYVVDNNQPLGDNKQLTFIFKKELHQGTPPTYSFEYDEKIPVCRDMCDALCYIVGELKRYAEMATNIFRYKKRPGSPKK